MKIICIGLTKTATNSVVDALGHLGFNLCHYSERDITSTLKEYDGIADLPAVRFYKEFDQLYPGSKFIYTIREEKSWLRSVESHYERQPPSTLGDWGKENREVVYGSMYFDKKQMINIYHKHDKEVREYFKDRPNDLLIVDICGGDGWDKLIDFLKLDVPIPSIPFPKSNTSPKRTQTVDAVYPYIIDHNHWEEIRYSIRALEQNFIDLRKIWIVGDKPEWANDKLGIIPCPRNLGNLSQEEGRNRDYCHKIFTASLHPEVSKTFLSLSDDHYILAPWGVQDFNDRQLVREDLNKITKEMKEKFIDSDWQRDLWYTYDRIKAEGFYGWSYETHTPKIIEKRKLIETFTLFGYGDGRLIWHTAYFNMHPVQGEASFSEDTARKVSVYKPRDKNELEASIRDAIFLNHNDIGLTEDLKSIIHGLFPEPSSYET